ncbi:MAG: FAD-binding oxidoreductase [Burkholderiales bacterium]|nr:FAD-binding oxidoreductase [Burkholderiales bacterium]
MTPISSWGRLSADLHDVICLTNPMRVAEQLAQDADKGPGVAYGMGRSYGDACLNPNGRLWKTTGLGYLIAFDDHTGRLTCEAGVLLRDIQQVLVPRGWMLPVTPGTQLLTVGGAIANDVHGKNHHVRGSFGDHVLSLKLVRTDGQVIVCGPQSSPDWFAATVGGLGLTGVIIEAEIQLQRIAGPWLNTETVPYTSLDAFFGMADSAEAGWEHTVSWVDCLAGAAGRGLFMRGNHADASDRPVPSSRNQTMPFTPPVSLVNTLSLRPFNLAYYHLKRWKAERAVVHYEPFFYPLDRLLEWNRMYGPKGFFQYQSVVPREVGRDAVQAMLREIARAGDGSFLAVLKTFGQRQAVGMLSFPRPGVTLALDFPNRGERTLKLLSNLDAIVRESAGRIYPAKDARMPRDLFEAGYPKLNEFLKYRDPGISSGLSRRLIGS